VTDFSIDANPSTQLMRLANGYQISQAIHVAAALGVADLLAEGARDSDDLAEATSTNARTLYRLLRALASVGVLREEEGRRFALTPLGEGLRADAPDPVAGWAAFAGRPAHWQAWGDLLNSVRTGENAYRHVHGMSVWEHRERDPEDGAAFDRAMTEATRRANRSLLDAYDFGRFGTVVDVGGGRGALLAALLERHPGMHGVLFDQPHVVAGAEVGERRRVVVGSFFDAVPEGGDAYVLKFIIHDWEDEEAAAILRVIRCAAGEAATLLVIERELGPPNENPVAKLSDLNMLVAPGGRERTLEEFAALFAEAGFRLVGATPTDSGLSVIEATPV
jgi:hypothetical protein